MRLRDWVGIAVLAVVYVGTAKLGIELPVARNVVTPVWLPTGLSIAALMLFGYRLWPGVLAGAFIANFASDVSAGTALGIAFGNTAEALVAVYILRKLDVRPALDRVRDVLIYVVGAAMLAPVVSATNGVFVLSLSDEIAGGSVASEWVLWWIGDLAGALFLGTGLLVWVTHLRSGRRIERPLEAAVLMILLVAVSGWVFVGGSWKYPYLVFPFLVWAAIRYRQIGATASVFVLGVIAVRGTLVGAVPLGENATETVEIVHALVAVLAVSTFMIAATISERESAEASKAELVHELTVKDRVQAGILGAVSDLGQGFVVTDAGRLVYANDAYCAMTGYTREELFALPSLMELSAPEERDALVKRMTDRLSGGHVADHYEATLIRKDGGRVQVEAAVKLMPTDEGPRIISIIRDVTERKKMEVMRDEFLAYAAHELRGPIAAMSGFAGVLRRRESLAPTDVDLAVERLSKNTETMALRLERLLTLARLQQGHESFHPEPVDLARLVDSVLRELAAPEGRSVEKRVPEGVTVEADPQAAEQIVTNLLTNSYRYGGSTITISARAENGRVRLAITDDGQGVPEELVSRLFDPFVRGAQARDSEGVGLGLAIVKALADASGLETGYEPAEPRGACFYVSFPAAAPSSPAFPDNRG